MKTVRLVCVVFVVVFVIGLGLTAQVRADPARQWCGGNDAVECPTGYLCDVRTFNCAGVGVERSNLIGVCVKAPDAGGACPLGTHPVCGCFGNSYANDCERVLAGEAKSADGPCNN